MNRVELLAPAGDLDKLKTAIDYGTDAVYLGGEAFGLRKASKNFPMEDIRQGVKYAHDRGAKVHVTMNIIPHNRDLEGIETYIKDLYEAGVDALIVADPGIFSIIKRVAPGFEIHMSTQGSLTNTESVKFWAQMGAKRAVLAREMSLDEIKKIIKETEGLIEIETFLHGAMCMSYSGRCLLSNYMTGRDANLGDCAQPCRFKYHLVEETRPGEYYPIEETDEGTFIMNSKDLCMIDHVDKLIEAGIHSLKIEGRVKTEFYLATVVGTYRKAIDAYYADPENYNTDPNYLKELEKVSHRSFTTGFYFGDAKEDAQVYENNSYIRTYDFVGKVLDYDPETKRATVEQRNRIFEGDQVEIFGLNKDFFYQTLIDLRDEEGNSLEVVNQPKTIFTMKVDQPVEAKDLIRKKRE